MASWFDSVGQSIGNFVSGHGFEDNSQRAIMDAQEEKKKREEQQKIVRQPVIQQRPSPNQLNQSTPQAPTPMATIQPASKPVIQQRAHPLEPNNLINSATPTQKSSFTSGIPSSPNATMQRVTPQVQAQPVKPTSPNYSNPFVFAGEFGKEWLKNAGNFVKTTAQGIASWPETTVRTLLSSATGKDQSLNINSLAPNDPRRVLYGEAGAPTNWKTASDLTGAVGLGRDNPISATIGGGLTALDLIPLLGKAVKLGLKPLASSGIKTAERVAAEETLKAAEENAIKKTATTDITQGLLESTNPEMKLLTEKSAIPPTLNAVLSSEGASAFVTKTPQQIAETAQAIKNIKKIDTTLNVIRQGKTSEITIPEVRSLMKKRNDLMSVANGEKTMQEATTPVLKETPPTVVAPDSTPLSNADLGTPGSVPTDATISATPTREQLSSIIDNTVNPVSPNTPKPKLTPQNEMGSIDQKPVDNFTGELGVNKNGQIYQKVSQAEAKDTAMKNLLDGKTPEEYLATAKQTGQADSAELAILMQQVPKDSPVWAELASLKGKLGTQKGQALALLEKTMRQSATADQLTSRTLQKANTAGFDTTQIADDIARVNQEFTAARDGYNAVLNNPASTNADIQAAKDAFYRVSKQSFTDESNILNAVAKTKEQKNLAYQLQKKSDVYLQGMATSSLTSSPTSMFRNFTQGVGALAHQAGLAPKVEALINRLGGGEKIGSFNTAGAKIGAKTGFENLKSEFSIRASQLGLTKNPVSWVKHPINTIRQITTTGTELGNIPMESAIRGGMSSEYRQILESQGYKGAELKNLIERNTITDPLDIRIKYAKEINDLNGLSSEFDRTGGTFRNSIKNQFTKLGTTDKTAMQLADFVDRDIFGFFKPTLIVGKKTADYATGGVAHLVPAIVKLSRGDKAGFVSEISKTIATSGVTLPVLGATGYALAKAGVLSQNDYGEWEINGVPISGYAGAFSGPMAMGAIVGQNLHDNNGDMSHAWDGFPDKVYQTLVNASPYGEVGKKFGSVGEVINGATGGVQNGQEAYGFKQGVADLLGGLGKETIPASSFLNTLNKMLGGNVKDTTVKNPKNATTIDAGIAGVRQAANQIAGGLPGVSNMLPDKTNSFGDTIAKPDPISSLLGASNPSAAESDTSTGITAVGSKDLNGVAQTNLITEDDKTTYNKVIKKLQDAGDQITDTNVFKELSNSGNYLLAAKYNKNINQSIDDTDKIALAKYDALDADHQKVYVQDQQNALDTYTAQLNNKQANGTLSQDDKETYKVWNGSGNSLLVKALVAKTNVENKVSTDTLNLYEQITTKREYNNLSVEQQVALDTYATQLKANGVNVRSFLAGGSGSGRGSSSKAKGASNVPLTKAVTSGGGNGGKFAHQDINVDIPQVVKPSPQYVIKQRKISVG